jgi:hypothetical protein
MAVLDPTQRQYRLTVRQEVISINSRGESVVLEGSVRVSNKCCLDCSLRFNMSRVGLLFHLTPISFHISIANLDDLVAKCSSNLFKSLVSCLPVGIVNS